MHPLFQLLGLATLALPVLVFHAARPDRARIEVPVQLATLPPGTVISTGDGDTLRVNLGGETATTRIACIDAPETTQPFGPAAADRLAQWLPVGTPVTLRVVDTDRYGRTVAEVYRAGQSVGLQLVAEGYAVVYDDYLDGCGATRDRYLQAEATAQGAQLNFWSQATPIMPWAFRQGETSPPATAAPLAPTAWPACLASDCDCGDFPTQAAAQAVLDAEPGDRHSLDLDWDHDGIACESLP